MLQEWFGNIETKISMHFINEFVSLLDPNMKKDFAPDLRMEGGFRICAS